MTTYSFATTRTDLGLEPGWTQIYGDATALKPVSGFINRSSVATSDHFYAEGSIVSGTQKAGYTFGTIVGSTTAPRLAVLGSGTVGAFTGYEIFPSSSTGLSLRRQVAGANTTLISLISVASSNAAFYLEAVVSAGAVDVNVYDSTGTQIGTYHDTTSTRPVSGYNGLRSVNAVASSANNGTNFIGNMQLDAPAAAAGGLTLLGAGS